MRIGSCAELSGISIITSPCFFTLFKVAIAVDTTKLFERADIVLLLATVGIILVLLIIIYRSPLLALIPLLAAAFVYEVVNQILGLFGKAGLDLASQSTSIMSILLFAATIDYSFHTHLEQI